jgi:hypothetical protein
MATETEAAEVTRRYIRGLDDDRWKDLSKELTIPLKVFIYQGNTLKMIRTYDKGKFQGWSFRVSRIT